MTIAAVQADHYRIPLPVALSDSTHGTMEAFELITVRVRDADGAEGLGYTYTVGAGGGAIRDLIARDLGAAARRRRTRRGSRRSGSGCGGGCTTSAAAASRCTRSRRSTPRSGTSWRGAAACRSGACSAATTRTCRPTPAASICSSRSSALLRQTEDNLAQGLPRDQDEGRPRRGSPRTSARVQAMRELLGPDVPLMVDANMRWSADRGDPRGARVRRARRVLARGADDPRRRAGPRPDRARGRPAGRGRREPAHACTSSRR